MTPNRPTKSIDRVRVQIARQQIAETDATAMETFFILALTRWQLLLEAWGLRATPRVVELRSQPRPAAGSTLLRENSAPSWGTLSRSRLPPGGDRDGPRPRRGMS